MFNLDHLSHLIEILTIVGIGWRGLRKIDRLISLWEDYPPHKHVNGAIVYPKGYEPAEVGHLGAGAPSHT